VRIIFGFDIVRWHKVNEVGKLNELDGWLLFYVFFANKDKKKDG